MKTRNAAWIHKRRDTEEYDLFEVVSWQPQRNTGEVSPRMLEILRMPAFLDEPMGLETDSEVFMNTAHHTPLPGPMALAKLKRDLVAAHIQDPRPA